MFRFFIVAILFIATILWHSPGSSPNNRADTLRVFFYNCENLFDTINDPNTDDDEFTPAGPRGWTWYKYRRKINSVFKVIAASGEWSPPDVISLCEIENRDVLNYLLKGTNLSKFNYGIVHKDSPDRRGIDVALIYNKDLLDIVNAGFIDPGPALEDSLRTREILHVKLSCQGEGLHILVNHWPSNRGGVAGSSELRLRVADQVRMVVDSIFFNEGPAARVILVGDLNCEYPDTEIVKGLEADGSESSKLEVLDCKVIDKNIPGTYKFQGIWYNYDNIIISRSLLSGKGISYNPGSFRIIFDDFLLEKDPDYPGVRPFSTFRGYRYYGGYSDHLPVVADFSITR